MLITKKRQLLRKLYIGGGGNRCHCSAMGPSSQSGNGFFGSIWRAISGIFRGGVRSASKAIARTGIKSVAKTALRSATKGITREALKKTAKEALKEGLDIAKDQAASLAIKSIARRRLPTKAEVVGDLVRVKNKVDANIVQPKLSAAQKRVNKILNNSKNSILDNILLGPGKPALSARPRAVGKGLVLPSGGNGLFLPGTSAPRRRPVYRRPGRRRQPCKKQIGTGLQFV